ncbi:dipeptide epimerase [Luteimonas sp. S4-F44]|uniref:dipeptide epimerase n=1 Tax=Luteimonas sp. S4-F44 TaxID=2925842 RepID=UPI001F539F0C|nr:dipeptide epimerase [Luteimonas sp. S4-F44]UNK44045.1 dipeptide epimerase [Luteimonas sp. S4-F44]
MRLTLQIDKLRMLAPFRISGYVFEHAPVLRVELEDQGHRGRGEASGVYYLDDTPEQMQATLEGLRDQIEAGVTRADLQQLLPRGGARNALDCALWDLEASRAGKPAWALAGLQQVRPLLTTWTLGADDPATMQSIAINRYAPAKALKLKLSGELEVDIERVRVVRQARPDVWIGVDANQGYTVDVLDALIPVLMDHDVRLLEQPLRRGREADLKGFARPLPFAADESVQDVSEIGALEGLFDVINIKLDKSGGLTEGLAMVETARALGMRVMVGNMMGSSWAMAPAFIVGQHCDVVDLDGPLVLAEDRVPGVRYDDGLIHCDDSVWGTGVQS